MPKNFNAPVSWSKLWHLNVSHEKRHMIHISFWYECFLKLGAGFPLLQTVSMTLLLQLILKLTEGYSVQLKAAKKLSKNWQLRSSCFAA